MGPWAAQVVGGSPRNSWSWDSVGFEVLSYPNHSMIPWNHYHHIWQNESDSFHTASTIIRHKKKCCHVTKQPCKSDFLGDFSSLNNDQLNHSRRWEDVLFLLWSISNFSTLGAFSLESNKEVCAYSCCWKLQHHNAMLLSLFSWYPFPFLGHPFDPRFLVNNAVCNVICTITYGERFDYGDKTFKKLLTLFENSLNEEAGFLPQVIQKHILFCETLPSSLESTVFPLF